MNTERLHLLIVEDEEAHVEAIRRAFDAAGTNADIHAVGTLRQYLELVAEHPIDIALVDLNLPDGRAVEILTSPPEEGPFPILVMTAFGNQQIVVEVMKAGALDYVVKSPEAFAMLPRTVEGALREWKLLQSHKQAVEALEEEAIRRRILIDQSRDGIVVLDQDGKVLEANGSYAKMLGYSADEMRQLHVWDWDTQWTREQLMEMIRSVDAAGDHFETRHRRKDGTVYDVEISTNAAICNGRKLIFCVCRDITERKRAEDALRASEQEFRSLAEAMPQIVWACQPDGRNIYLNQQYVDYTGLTLEESYGHGWNKPFHPDDQQRAWDAWQNATQNDATYELEVRLRRADGAYHWWLIRGVPMRDANGKILKWFGTCTDIEDMKQAEEVLERERNLLRTLIDHIPDSIYVRDTDNRFVLANETVARRMGAAKPAELVGKTDADFYPAEQAAHFAVLDREVLAGRALVNFEEDISHLDGKRRTILGTKVPLKDSQGAVIGLIGIGRDITERKQAEEALRQQTEELRAHNVELERFNKASVGRELRMIELKQEINQLCQQAGLPPRYPIQPAEESGKDGNHTSPTKSGRP